MIKGLSYKEMAAEDLSDLAYMYVETFNSEPWNDRWTIETATKRLQQMINTEDSYGLCVYHDNVLCGALLGCMEQFYDGIMFNLKEFWIKNEMRGNGIGSAVFSRLEEELKQKGVTQIILFTSKGDYTEAFYNKNGLESYSDMIFMSKRI